MKGQRDETRLRSGSILQSREVLIRWQCTGNDGTLGTLLRDAVLFLERIFVVIEQQLRAMGSQVGENRALFGDAKLEIGYAAGIAQYLGLPDPRRNLLRQAHGKFLLPSSVNV